ncbi:hypothetical protein Tsubulata_002306 [Turnera subulata]|uniref:DYW domain-containing protein n=1 Tax=Turnera subulata TaxID=218843 RepID=A0A9Q0J6E1_9ROSI|nr:hypothetical protein Tsubulata_002306 [Turnera subulata]
MLGRGVEALEVFDKMRKQGLVPDGVTLLVVLYACSHSGLVDQGIKYFDGMNKEFGVVPGAKHYACMVDLLGRAGRLDDARYDILIKGMPYGSMPNNLGGSTAQWHWKDVCRIRSLMKHKGIRKRPGCSWVQGKEGTATFFVGDRTRPEANQIYELLADLIERIKVLGYVPDTSFALHDVGDKENTGDLLWELHSEKLALAYGRSNFRPHQDHQEFACLW